jgi:hypothetical protein
MRGLCQARAVHVLDRLLWLVVRLLPAVPLAPWLRDAPLDRRGGPIGAAWPARQAAELGRPLVVDPDLPLIDLSKVAHIDADALPPMVRAYYAHSGRFRLSVVPRWLGPLWLGVWAYNLLYPRRWGQLELPLRGRVDFDDALSTTGAEHAGPCLVRCYRGSERTLYVSHFDLVDVDGKTQLRITFPVPGGAWVVLLRLAEVPRGLLLTELGEPSEPLGLYFVPAEGRPRYARGLIEEIAVLAVDGRLAVEHTFDLLGVRILTLHYTVEPCEGSST